MGAQPSFPISKSHPATPLYPMTAAGEWGCINCGSFPETQKAGSQESPMEYLSPLEERIQRECTLDFRRQQLEKGGGLLCLPGEDRRVLALNSFAFLWFKSRIFFFIYIIIILSCWQFFGGLLHVKAQKIDNPVTELLKLFLWCVFTQRAPHLPGHR